MMTMIFVMMIVIVITTCMFLQLEGIGANTIAMQTPDNYDADDQHDYKYYQYFGDYCDDFAYDYFDDDKNDDIADGSFHLVIDHVEAKNTNCIERLLATCQIFS